MPQRYFPVGWRETYEEALRYAKKLKRKRGGTTQVYPARNKRGYTIWHTKTPY